MFVITILLLVVNAALYMGESMTKMELIWSYMMYIIAAYGSLSSYSHVLKALMLYNSPFGVEP